MNILFAYYSLEGNCRSLAQCMREAVGGDVEEIVPVSQPIPDAKLMNTLHGGFMSMRKEMSELKPFSKNPHDYDLVVVGGPVWAWNVAPPTRAFLTATDWKGVKTALFSMAGGPNGATLKTMRNLVEEKGGAVLAAENFRDLRKGNPDATRKKAVDWIREAAALGGRKE